MKILNKIVSIVVIFSLITAMVMPIKDAEAQGDVIGGPFQIFSTIFNETKDLSLQTILKQAALAMAGNLLDQMTTSTANWVAGGFDGKPLFVENPGIFFTNVANTSANEFLGRLQNSAANAGSTAWLTRLLPLADNMCKGGGSNQAQREADFLDILKEKLNPGIYGPDANGIEAFTVGEIRTFFDQNQPPITIDEITEFAKTPAFSTSEVVLTESDISEIKDALARLNVKPNDVETSCACGAQAELRISESQFIEGMGKEELAKFLLEQGSNTTAQSYLDTKAPISSCIVFQEKYGQQDFAEAGGYTRGIIQFLGQTYNDPKGSIATLAPNYDGLPKDIKKQVSQNWTKFASQNGNFSAGGWNSWNQLADPRNNPLASKYLFQNALKEQTSGEVKKFKEELDKGNGFLDAKKCTGKKIKLPDGSEKCPAEYLVSTTPGNIVSDQIAKALNVPLAKTENIQDWGDILKVSLARMASKLTTAGITAISNEASRQSNIAKGTYAGIGGDILAKTSTTNNGAGTGASEVLDLEEFFLGKPVQKIKKDAAGHPVYEVVINQLTGQPQVDQSGNIVYDTNKPVYLFEQQVDADGKLVFQNKVMGLNGREAPLDQSTWNSANTVTVQVPVYDLTKPVYEDGFDLFSEGGRPVMEEPVAENHELVVVTAQKVGEGRVRLSLYVPNPNAGIDLSKRVIVWKDVRAGKVVKTERGGTTYEDNLSCAVGGCHNVYEATISDNKGGTIYKLVSVWRNLTANGVEWKNEISGGSEAAPSTGELKLADGKDGTPAIPLYQKDDNGDIVYESKRDAAGAVILDVNGNPVPDTTKPKRAPLRRGGALARVYYMNWILSKEREQIRQLPQAAKTLDQCIPGPDYNWDKRLQSKYDKLTQKYGGKKPEQVNHLLVPLKEIGQAVYTIMSGYQEGNPPEGCTGSKPVEPYDHNKVTLEGAYNNDVSNTFTLKSNDLSLGEARVKWETSDNVFGIFTIRETKDDTPGDGIHNATITTTCVSGADQGCLNHVKAIITFPNGTKIVKEIDSWTWIKDLKKVRAFGHYNGWSEGASRPVGQSIYNLTGNINVGIDCLDDGYWYQQYNGNGYNWGFLGLNAKDMQWLGGYELKDDGEIIYNNNAPKKILNIPSANSSREVFDSAKSKYSRKYKQIAEQQSELSGLKRNIDKLYEEYTDGARDKNLIARDVAALREDLPFAATINREYLFLQQINEDIEKIYETATTCLEEKVQPKYYDIYFKDEMQVLYCPLQSHAKINVAPRLNKIFNYDDGNGNKPNINWHEYRNNILQVIGSRPQKDLGETLKSMPKGFKITRYILAATSLGITELNIMYFGGIIDAFTDTTAEKYVSWLSHPKPNRLGNDGNGGDLGEYMCWETSYEESPEAGNTGEDKKIGKNNGEPAAGECPGQSDWDEPKGDGKFAVERLELLCKDFYKSSLSDYNELFGITQNNTLP